MRKMKKINGYLVVRFNDRERRERPQLGAYGVIDAEVYTGYVDIDVGAMEYDDAGSLEEAAELARGLDSELEPEEPEERPLPKRPEALCAYVCDELCRHRAGKTQEELDALCEQCSLEQLAGAADEEERRTRDTAIGRLTAGVEDISKAVRRGGAAAEQAWCQGYLSALADTGTVTGTEETAFSAAIAASGTAAPAGAGFRHLDMPTQAVCELGLALEADCPDNDCRVYHTTYCNHLNAWVRSCETVKDVKAITYGVTLPENLAANMEAVLNAASV